MPRRRLGRLQPSTYAWTVDTIALTTGALLRYAHEQNLSPDAIHLELPAIDSSGEGMTRVEANSDKFKLGGLIDINPAGCTAGLMSSLSIPESVMSIGRNAFAGCRSLTSLDIPNGVTGIRDGTFDGCSSLMTLSIPTSVAQIGQGAFVGCSSLTTLTIPESVTCIKAGCISLTRLDVPNAVTEIGVNAFHGCSSLTSLTIPETVREIGSNDEETSHSKRKRWKTQPCCE